MDHRMNQFKPDGLDPIQDMGPSPSAAISAKRSIPPSEQLQSPTSTINDAAPYRNHQVHYSFGQQPFNQMQLSQRVGDGSGQNSIRQGSHNSGPGTQRVGEFVIGSGDKNIHNPSGNPMMSSMVSGEGESNANSKGPKSAVSMASVMGTFEQQTSNGMPNIFHQSMQNKPGQSSTSGQVNMVSKSKSKQKPPPVPMTQTQQNFTTTAKKVETIDQMVSEGLTKGKDRQSQHSLEAEQVLGLRKSQQGLYQHVDQADSNVPKTADNMTVKSAVPDEVRNQMIQRGFRPSSKQEGQFEYDSDTVEKYEMISNEFDYEQVREGTDFGIKQYKDCIYRGQLNHQRQREGLGVLVYQNGRVYEGEWLKNKRHGRGYEVFTTGNSYHGTYEDGKANGKGVYQWQNGEVYDGEWLQGIKHGYGVWKGTNGESYIGQWVSSKAEGYGVHVFANGDKYEGEWNQCLREGNGSDFFANGDSYVGQYAKGKPEGFGQYKWKNGSSYTGQFLNGLKHGHGKWKKKQADEFGNTQCNSYEGLYEYDKKHGYGVFEWESGNRYEGNYLEDERHGYGVMKWTDESTYMGIWDQGIQHGVGVMVFPDDVKRAGIFEENVFKESLKRKDQIDPYRDQLKDECLDLLDEILIQKTQSKANLFGPLQRSKAELVQNDPANADLNIESGSIKQRESKEMSVKNNGPFTSAHDLISDNTSMINQPLPDADKEDHNMTMQKGNPMRDSMGKSARKPVKEASIQASDAALPPLPATANQKQIGKAIEVQTDLSMVTMEQYSQGYNSKAFMNKTHDFKDAANQNNQDNTSVTSPNIKYQNDLNNVQNSVTNDHDFQNVLSNPQFQDTKHQQEILGGGNPNEDTESEWNRNNSSMMVRNPNLMMTGTQHSVEAAPAMAFEIQNTLASRGKIPTKQQSLGHRQRSNDAHRQRAHGANNNNQQPSPYASLNRKENLPPSILPPKPRENVNRNAPQGRQGQRIERSMPHAQAQNMNQNLAPNQFVVPGPQGQQQRPSKSINRHNVVSLINEQKKSMPPSQKFFQSQYGSQRFGGNQAQMPYPQVFSQNQSVMQHHPNNLMETPDMRNRASFIPNSEQPRSLHAMSRVENQGEQPGFPNIGANRMQQQQQQQLFNSQNQDTPVTHQNFKRHYPTQGQRINPNLAMQQYVSGFDPLAENRREDILTPSPKIDRESKQSEMYNPAFNRSVGQQAFANNYNQQQNPHTINRGNDMSIADGEGVIAVEPMFGNEYGQGVFEGPQRPIPQQQQINNEDETRVKSMVDENGGFFEGYRGKTATSSQRTLRYNDFELIQKQAENDPNYAVDIDEADDKNSSRISEPGVVQKVGYPDIKMHNNMYESRVGPAVSSYKQQAPFGSNRQTRETLPKMHLGQSIQYQQSRDVERRHLNSNDTQLAQHTIHLNASQEASEIQDQSSRRILPNNRIVQRSLPPAHHSKISVKKNISIMNPADVRVGRFQQGSTKTTISPKQYPSGKFYGKQKKQSNSNSRGRFDFVGPYAQNLKKPKLFEARGTQKIAMKNHLASLASKNGQNLMIQKQAQGQGPFNSEVFQKRKSQMGAYEGQHRFETLEPSIDDRGDKHTHRFNSHDDRHHTLEQQSSGNYVIQHQSLQARNQYSNSQMPPLNTITNAQQEQQHFSMKGGKRVWVPYNKKLKLKGMQQNMQQTQVSHQRMRQNGSTGSGNPLLNSQ